MDVLSPTSLDDALALKAQRPDAAPLAGGTDVMVELNLGSDRPPAILDLTRVPELRERGRDDSHVRFGAGVTYTQVLAELAPELPGLAIAARTIGSPQIRNRGTVGGNLGTASPAGDALPPLCAAGATVEVASVRGARTIPARAFVVAPKVNALDDDELIVAIRSPVARGPQQFAKIGTRNAMVIAVASFAVALDARARTVSVAIGSAGPRILDAPDAARFATDELADLWEPRAPLPDSLAARFGELAAAAARPIDDVRGSARYRRHALAVLARRTLTWAWNEQRRSPA
ncbi:MAG TPA: FAD binding domain-containing protein [Actinomycetota bacterium]|nr:FAD binding domain-containing protein [Actinomycetota bacterium]